MELTKQVSLVEVGPRDGLQFEKIMLSVEQKLELIEMVVDAGMKNIEIGSFVHPKAVPQMADTDELAKRLPQYPGVTYSALIMNLRGAQRALDSGITKVKMNTSASLSHNLKNQKCTPEESVKRLDETYQFCVKNSMQTCAGISMAFGCPIDGDVPVDTLDKIVARFIEMGVTAIAPADTAGLANPLQTYDTMKFLVGKYPQVFWGVHLHNTRGLALANTFASLQAGVVEFGACFAGIGGCPFAPGASGNSAMEDVIFLMESVGVKHGVDLKKYIGIADKVQGYIGRDTDTYQLHVSRAHAALAACSEGSEVRN